jgi:coenzyme F420-reducing hydrogenase delta subunit
MTQPWVAVLGCAHSAQVALDDLKARGVALPQNVRFASLRCGAELDELNILELLQQGAERVLVLVCCDGACRSVNGGQWAEKRVQAVQGILSELEMDPACVELHKMAPNMPMDLLAWVTRAS